MPAAQEEQDERLGERLEEHPPDGLALGGLDGVRSGLPGPALHLGRRQPDRRVHAQAAATAAASRAWGSGVTGVIPPSTRTRREGRVARIGGPVNLGGTAREGPRRRAFGSASASSSASSVIVAKVDVSASRPRYRSSPAATSSLEAGWTTRYRPHVHSRLGCWSIDSRSRCSSHTRHSGEVLRRRSVAPGANAPASSATARVRHRFWGFGVSGLSQSWYSTSIPTIPRVPSPRSRMNAASNARRLLSHCGSRRPGEWANRTSTTVPGASGTHARSARVARAWSAARSPNRLKAIAGAQSRSAQVRWWSKLCRGSGVARRIAGRVEGARRHELGARRLRVVEREPAPDGTGIDAGARTDRLRADRVAVGRAPSRLVEPDPAPERGRRRTAGQEVDGLPAEGRLELRLGRLAAHPTIVRFAAAGAVA